MNHCYDSATNIVVYHQIWDTLGQGDLGCSAGGGQSSNGVFLDAGLNFKSNVPQSSNSYGTFFFFNFNINFFRHGTLNVQHVCSMCTECELCNML